jgi:hypothetical protein
LPQEYAAPPPPQQPYAPQYAPPPAPRKRSRTPLLVLGLLVLLAGVGVGIAAAAGAFKTSTNTVTTQITSTGQPTSADVSESDVRDVLSRYQSAYSGKDLQALDALFAPDFKRRAPPRPDMGRAAALREYARQFGNLTNPSYTLSNQQIKTEAEGATATADYTIDADNAQPASGTIGFAMVRRDGKLLIEAIAIRSGG